MQIIRLKTAVHRERHGVLTFVHTHVHGLAVAAVAAGSAATAVLVSARLLPYYSLNRDEPVYIDMARMLEHGHVTLPVSRLPFRPWASGVVSDHIALKYTPPWPSVIAIGDSLTGTTRAALALNAAFVLAAVYWLARTLQSQRWAAVVAAVLVACSPFFIVQSGTYLPYLFTLGLCCASAAATLRYATAHARTWKMAGAGVLGGLAVFARAFDAALMLAPVLVAALLAALRANAKPGRLARDWALGAAMPVAGMLVFNWRTMGSPFTMPFSVTGSSDTFGFGRRGIFEASTVRFDFVDGLSGMFTNLRWIASWVAGGIVLIGLAATSAWRALRTEGDHGSRAILSWVVLFPIAYLAFWGPWAMSHNWKGVESLGPYYHLPLLVPIAIFGARALVDLARDHQRVFFVCLLAMIGLTVSALPDKQQINERATSEYRAAATAVAASSLQDAILFLPFRGESGFLDLAPFLHNDPDLDQSVLYAEDRGDEANREVLARYAGRTGWVLELTRPPASGATATFTVRRVESERAR